jgi:cytochrome b561
MKRNFTKIILDLMMAITFVLLMNPRVFDGLPFHEIAGLLIGVAILAHIGLNFRWVINTTKKILDPKLPKKQRFNFLINVLLLAAMTAVIVTGILISRVVVPSLAIQGSHTIRELHGLSADATLALVGLHIGVHWHWILSICKKAFQSKEGKLRKGVIVSVVLSLAILAGGIQWFASTTTASKGTFNPKKMEQFTERGNAGDMNAAKQGTPDKDFREGKFHGREGHGGSSNPFLVVLNYFAIWGVIIVPAYYLEKRILRNRRNVRNSAPIVS